MWKPTSGTGSISGFLGVPDAQQRANQDAGGTTAKVMERLSQLKAAEPNLPPNGLLQKMIADPIFIDAVASGTAPELSTLVGQMITAMQPEKPEAPQKLGPGDALVGQGEDGSYSPLFTNPSTETLSGQKPITTSPGQMVYDPVTQKMVFQNDNPQFAPSDPRLKTGPGDIVIGADGKPIYSNPNPQFAPQDRSQEQEAVDNLIASGALDRATGDKVLAGVLKIVPGTNAVGEPTGENFLYDLATNTMKPLSSVQMDGSGQVPQPQLPGAPAQGAPPSGPASLAAPAAQNTPASPGGKTFGMPQIQNAFAHVESRGNYRARGPVVTYKTGKRDRAFGKYQVMGSNIPSWTREALGRSMTPEQFLADPTAQDTVFNYKIGQYLKQFGNINDAASMWFTGKPYDEALSRGASDGYNRVDQYVSKINAALGLAPGTSGSVGAVEGTPPADQGNGGFASAAGPQVSPPPTLGADAALGAGALPSIANGLSSVLGQVDPALIDEDTSRLRSAAGILNEAIVDWGRSTGRAAVAEQARVLGNLGVDTGIFANPVQSLIKMQEFRRTVVAQTEEDRALFNDRQQPKEIRVDAQKKVLAGERLLAAIGNEDDINRALKTARTTTGTDQWKRLQSQLSKALSAGEHIVDDANNPGVSPEELTQIQTLLKNPNAEAPAGFEEQLGRLSPAQRKQLGL